MFRITAVRRFQAAVPRLQPPVASHIQAASSLVSNASSVTLTQGRVAMMPSGEANGSVQITTRQQSTTSDATASDAVSTLTSQEDILSVGTVSIQGHEHKVSTVA